jgi:hypothetical protein
MGLIMEPIESVDKKCLIIKPSGVINQVILSFDKNLDSHVNKDNTLFEDIKINMGMKYNCPLYFNNIASAFYPDHSYYSIFYGNKILGKKAFNKTATKLINDANIKCYGDCYIIHFDSFYELHDIGQKTFIDAYNHRYSTNKGMVNRTNTISIDALNRIVINDNSPEKNKCAPCIII